VNFCSICGAPVWRILGLDVLTCRRGHHWPILEQLRSERSRDMQASEP
jgi:hypothetical protein